MTGRHRKQSTTARTAAKVAATGAMLGGAGLALSAPAAANAAPDQQWDQVAACESGGNWGINTGNGYHGGLQFSPSTWAGYGGTQYAPTANQATKAQQIAIAEKVLAGQGKGAWPVCGVGLGAPTPRTAPATEAPKATTPAAKKPVAAKPAAKKPVAKKPVAKKPVPKKAQKVTAAPAAKKVVTTATKSPNAAYVQQLIAQAQSGGKQIDPAILAALQQAAAKGY